LNVYVAVWPDGYLFDAGMSVSSGSGHERSLPESPAQASAFSIVVILQQVQSAVGLNE